MEYRSVSSLLAENQQAYFRREEEIELKMQGASPAEIKKALCEDLEYRRLGINEKRLLELAELERQIYDD